MSEGRELYHNYERMGWWKLSANPNPKQIVDGVKADWIVGENMIALVVDVDAADRH
jgi:hypothetical protein